MSAAGNPGGDTTFGAVLAKGGSGGAAGSTAGTTGSTARGFGGIAGTGDFTTPGGDGAGGMVLSASLVIGAAGGGSQFSPPPGVFAVTSASPQSTGIPAHNYGGGGGGALNAGTFAGLTGQPGAPGVVRVWEFA